MALTWLGRATMALKAQLSGKSVERVYIESTFHSPRGISYALTNPLEVTPYYHHFYEDVEETYNDRFLAKHKWFDIAHIMENFDDIVHSAIEYLIIEIYVLRQNPEVIARFPELASFSFTDLNAFRDCDAIDDIIEKANELLLGSLPEAPGECANFVELGLTRIPLTLREHILAHQFAEVDLSNNPIVKWPESFLTEKTKIQKINLSNTRIDFLPDDFLRDAPHVTHIDLGNVPLKRLPKYMLYASKKIEQLNISGGLKHLRRPSHWPESWTS